MQSTPRLRLSVCILKKSTRCFIGLHFQRRGICECVTNIPQSHVVHLTRKNEQTSQLFCPESCFARPSPSCSGCRTKLKWGHSRQGRNGDGQHTHRKDTSPSRTSQLFSEIRRHQPVLPRSGLPRPPTQLPRYSASPIHEATGLLKTPSLGCAHQAKTPKSEQR